jgi:hypothetical protein
MPLPKRGPHLRKRPPSPSPPRPGAPRIRAQARTPSVGRTGGSRSAGRGGHQPRPERVSVPRGLGRRRRRQGPAAAHSRPTTRRPDRTDDRASTDARPRLQPPVPTPDSSPAPTPPPSASPRWSTHRSQIRHQPTHHCATWPKRAKPPHLRRFREVGATGFEPATFRPPAECATRESVCRQVPPTPVQACLRHPSSAELCADWALESALGDTRRERHALDGSNAARVISWTHLSELMLFRGSPVSTPHCGAWRLSSHGNRLRRKCLR